MWYSLSPEPAARTSHRPYFWFANFALIPAVVPSGVPLMTNLEPSTVTCWGLRMPFPTCPALLYTDHFAGSGVPA